MSSIMLMRLQEMCKSCRASCYFIFIFCYFFILAQSGKIILQEFYFILFYCKLGNHLKESDLQEAGIKNKELLSGDRVHITSITWTVRLSWLENAYLHPFFGGRFSH